MRLNKIGHEEARTESCTQRKSIQRGRKGVYRDHFPLCTSIPTDKGDMNIHKETGVRQYTCCPGGKRTSAKETVHIKGTDRTIEHTWRPHTRGVQVTSTLIKKNGQKGQVKMAVVADELEAVTDVCRAHIVDIAKACKRAPLPRQQPKKETRAIVRQREAGEAASRRAARGTSESYF